MINILQVISRDQLESPFVGITVNQEFNSCFMYNCDSG